MRLGMLLALLCAAGSAGGPAPAAAGQRVAVAWDDVSLTGRLAALDAAPPYAFVTPTLALGGDGLLRADGARLFHLSRSSGVLTRVDPTAWSVVQSYALGAANLPRDVAVVGANTVYVSRRDARFLARLDLTSGALANAVDLAPLGAGDGNPAQDTMLVHDGRLYLQLAGEPGTGQPHAIAVVDLASETLVDANPSLPGVQGIALTGTGPRFKMQIVPGANELLVSATGAFHDDGGLERISLAALASLGLEVFEQIEAGADLGAFVQMNGSRGWLVFSTDLLLSSHLHAYTFEAGMEPFEADVSLNYFVPHLVYVPASDTLFWPEPDGVEPFDGTTGASRAGATPLPVAGIPTDLELLAGPPVVPALPGWALLAFSVLAAAGTRRARRALPRPRPAPRTADPARPSR